MSARSMRRRAARAVAVGLAGLLALPGPAWAVGPLEKDHPLVQRGRESYAAGRYEDALRDFEAAKKERPNDPAVEFNRADALAKLGRTAEAREAFKQVAESSRQPDLAQKSWYNLGNLAATSGDRTEALKSYRKALTLDPTDPQARHNYEVVLRDLPPPQNGPDGGTDGGQDGGSDGGRPDGGEDGGKKDDGGTPQDAGQDGGAPDGGADGGQDGGAPDGGADGGADGGGGDAGPGDGGADGGSDAGQQDPNQKGDGGADGGTADGGQDEGDGDSRDGGADGGSEGEEEKESNPRDGGVSPGDVDRQEAERLLDAMKQNEKNLQLWRFQQQKKKQRKPNEKDW
ncbi:tetratricopeptide repeat protein [Corallococcus silvisoli]|uniref:tetratricopeptide repeat protein n=1 Tax=Corallococcus silvisoli TaxID=2697031 RepID=UPI001376E531|nr:tetratricopeptide repeat protein [Corallococcus silvisoli]NBD14170.1 tetratricopeptide repeat protein [Corallococcus silvisoli]